MLEHDQGQKSAISPSAWPSPSFREVPGGTGSMGAPQFEVWRSLAKFGEVW